MEVRQHTEEQTVEGKQQWLVRRRKKLNSRSWMVDNLQRSRLWKENRRELVSEYGR
jgi:hypothetical protein